MSNRFYDDDVETFAQVSTPDDIRKWLDANSHGHAWKRPDGMKARCMGPPRCPSCVKEERIVAELRVIKEAKDTRD